MKEMKSFLKRTEISFQKGQKSSSFFSDISNMDKNHSPFSYISEKEDKNHLPKSHLIFLILRKLTQYL